MVLFLFDNVIHVLLLLCLCILIVCLEYYGKLWNEQGSKVKKEQKKRGEAKGQTTTET